MSETNAVQVSWAGGLRDGNGVVTLGSGVMQKTPFTFEGRFGKSRGHEGCTNPEEHILAGLAECFAMALSDNLERAGGSHIDIDVTGPPATITTNPAGHPTVSRLHIDVTVNVAGLDDASVQKICDDTFENCPIARLLRGGSAELTSSYEISTA